MRGRPYSVAGWLSVVGCCLVALGLGAGLGYAPRAVGGISGGGGGELELVERQSVSAVAAITFSGLDGDADNLYFIAYTLESSGALVVEVKPNDLATNQTDESGTISAGSNAGTDGTTLRLLDTGVAGTASGFGWIHADKARRRAVWSSNSYGNANVVGRRHYGFWHETSTNITSLHIDCSANDVTGIVALYKLASAGD